MSTSALRSRRGWGPPGSPLVFLGAVALPLSVWASPGAHGPSAWRLAAGVALCLLVSLAPRGLAAAARAPFPARAYFALGAGFALFHESFAANELAGVMLLFVPLAAALAVAGRPKSRAAGSGVGPPARPDGLGQEAEPQLRVPGAGAGVRGAWRLQAALLALLFGGLLAAAGSRGGFLALLAASGAMLLARRRRGVLGLALLAAALLALAAPRRWIDRALYDGKAHGLTVDSLLTGRPEIWRRSLHAAADFAVTGVGVGSYPQVVPALYFAPGSGALEDAHNLFLQTALDLGVFGLLALSAILWRAFRRVLPAARRGPPGSLRAAWALGLFGSLVAFTFFNLFDAVGLASVGGVGFWCLLGLIFALPAAAVPGGRRWRPRRLARARRILVLAALLTLLGLPSARRALELDRAAVLAARALTPEPALLPAAEKALASVRTEVCRAGWLEGKVSAARGRREARDAAWARLLRCPRSRLPLSGGQAFVRMVEDQAPDSRALAEVAARAQPGSAEARFWLARLRAAVGERSAAEDLYRQGLELAPRAGLASLELGRLLAPHDPPAALAAYAESCRHGDPGANGCLAAGDLAERLGDVEAALGYYRMSQFSGAQERAARLEREAR